MNLKRSRVGSYSPPCSRTERSHLTTAVFWTGVCHVLNTYQLFGKQRIHRIVRIVESITYVPSTPTNRPTPTSGTTGALSPPYESGVDFFGDFMTHQPLGPATNSQGQFTDNPNGACRSLPFTQNLTESQTIEMFLNGQYYTVRYQQTWTESDPGGSRGFGHGQITNGIDVSVSR